MITVVIPVGPTHEAIAERAIASVRNQTMPCKFVVVHDSARRGPGWARNVGLQQVDTEFVTFLDADDWLNPKFAERTLHAFTGGSYIYTDWYEGDLIRSAPPVAWHQGSWHIVTTMIPTAWAREVGGFDESLPGAEDTDFYHKMLTRTKCGRHWPEGLVHYSDQGQRGRNFRFGPHYAPVMEGIQRKYKVFMAGCGCIKPSNDNAPTGDPQPGDVMVQAMWSGNRVVFGHVTGRRYPRTAYPKRAWVDPRDAAAAPHEWAVVPLDTREAPKPESPTKRQGLAVLAEALMGSAEPMPYRPASPVEVPFVSPKPNFSRVIDLAQRSL